MDSTETYISLYSGGGGLDLGFRRANPDAQCVAYVEHEASAAALLVDHVEAELLDAAPLFTDAFTFPAKEFHGLVDWIIGGPPCQPFSVAGKRRGADDARNLWPLTLRMVGEIQPRGCFFENVGARDSLWHIYSEVIPGLRYMGYEVEAGIFSAAEVGAPHNRERIFILAHNNDRRRREWADATQPESAGGLKRVVESGNSELANTTSRRISQPQERCGVERKVFPTGKRQQGEHRADSRGTDVGDANNQGPQRRNRSIGERGDELPAWPPGPQGDWSSIPERLWPAVKPEVRSVAHGMAPGLAGLSRSQRLRIIGNGVVPATAERAFRELSK